MHRTRFLAPNAGLDVFRPATPQQCVPPQHPWSCGPYRRERGVEGGHRGEARNPRGRREPAGEECKGCQAISPDADAAREAGPPPEGGHGNPSWVDHPLREAHAGPHGRVCRLLHVERGCVVLWRHSHGRDGGADGHSGRQSCEDGGEPPATLSGDPRGYPRPAGPWAGVDDAHGAVARGHHISAPTVSPYRRPLITRGNSAAFRTLANRRSYRNASTGCPVPNTRRRYVSFIVNAMNRKYAYGITGVAGQ